MQCGRLWPGVRVRGVKVDSYESITVSRDMGFSHNEFFRAFAPLAREWCCDVRNLGVDLFDIVPAQLATYFLSFHLGLFAAGLACRHARHISIDALSPWLSTEVKRHVTSVVFVISGLTCLWLGWLAWRYVFELLGPDVHVLADRTGFLWSERTWKMPMILSFGLMAVHFFVNARRARAGAFDEEVPS